MTDAREVIARAVYGQTQWGYNAAAVYPDEPRETPQEIAAGLTEHDMADPDFSPYLDDADAIISALDAAGWCLVRKDGRDHLIRTMEKNGVYLTAELDYADDSES